MTIEKLIFLDIDGAICTPATKFLSFDPICMKHLKSVINQTNAFIVISSVWRKMHPFPKLKEMFEPFGLFNHVLGVTPELQGDMVRGKEIAQWIEDNKNWQRLNLKQFVIIDDDSDMEPHMDRLVKTIGTEGLTEEDAKKCIEMLNSD